jgi:hypothetical protein
MGRNFSSFFTIMQSERVGLLFFIFCDNFFEILLCVLVQPKRLQLQFTNFS